MITCNITHFTNSKKDVKSKEQYKADFFEVETSGLFDDAVRFVYRSEPRTPVTGGE